jgi:hypothetical protein
MEHLPTAPSFVGIDVSKDRLDVHVRPSGQTLAVQRNDEGLEDLVSELRKLAPALIVLEATGGFEVTVAAALASANLPVAVVNPRQIRDFARAVGRLAKTDALDAQAIALFAERIRPEPRPLADADSQSASRMVGLAAIAASIALSPAIRSGAVETCFHRTAFKSRLPFQGLNHSAASGRSDLFALSTSRSLRLILSTRVGFRVAIQTSTWSRVNRGGRFRGEMIWTGGPPPITLDMRTSR